VINDNVAHINANTEFNLLIWRQIGIARPHLALNVDGATNRIYPAGKLHQDAIACRLHNSTTVFRDRRIEEGIAQGALSATSVPSSSPPIKRL
jgi:hypothetical protein